MADPANDVLTTGQEPVSAEEPDAQVTGFSPEYIASLREEAAKYRNQHRESEARATAAEEQVSELTSQLESANGQLEELKPLKPKVLSYEAAAEAGLPLKHASRLKGDSFEELTQDAKSLADDIAPRQPTPTQIFSPGAGSTDTPKQASLAEKLYEKLK